jgi:hypothetical protein
MTEKRQPFEAWGKQAAALQIMSGSDPEIWRVCCRSRGRPALTFTSVLVEVGFHSSAAQSP